MNIAGVFKGIRGLYQSSGGISASAGKGAMGALGVVGTGFSMYGSHVTHSDRYGTGGAAVLGAGEAALFLLPLPIALAGAAAIYGLPALKDYGQSVYKENRKLSMGQPIDDRFGTAATMRQRSSSTLQRGRAILGSEARLYHY